MSPSPSAETGPTYLPGHRFTAFDGLRGITILLVMVNHANGTLWARDVLADIPVVGSLLGGGSVTMFFVIGAFIVTRNLLRDRQHGELDAPIFFARRVVRLGVHLVPLAAVVMLLQEWDHPARYDLDTTVESVLGVLTFTLNLLPDLATRADLGHLWYLSVQQQCYLVLPLLVLVLGRWRPALVAVCAAGIAGVTVWRLHVLETAGWIAASKGTLTRSDGLLLGVLLAAALPWLSRRPGWARWALPASALAALGLLSVRGELPPFAYLKAWGVAYMLVCGVLVVAVVLAPRSGFTMRVLSAAPVAAVGRASLALYVWHLPVILLVSQHLAGRPWYVQTAVAVLVVAVIAVVSERFVDGPVRAWLKTHLRPARRGAVTGDDSPPVPVQHPNQTVLT